MHPHRLAFVALGSLVLVACGSTITENPGTGGEGGTGANGGSSTTTGGEGGVGGIGPTGGGGTEPTGGGGTGGVGGGIGAQPPGPPANGVPGDGPGYAFVVDQLFVGDTNLDGSPDPSAWRSFGFNLDGLISTSGSTDLCQPSSGGSPSSVYPDGDAGIDNAWGKLLLPIWTGLAQDFSQQINESITMGDRSYLLEVPSLGLGADYLGLETRFFVAGPLGSTPAFDGSDVWPIGGQSLEDVADPTSSKWAFAQSYVNGHTLVTSPVGSVEVLFDFGGFGLPIAIHHATLATQMAPDRSGAVNGVISGILDTEEHIAALQQVAGSIDEGLCSGTTFDSLADQIRQASDILLDGTQDPNQTCNGITIGLGFTASAVQLGGVFAPPPPPPNPCL